MPSASFTFHPKRSRMITTPDPWWRQLSYYIRLRDCGPADRVEGTAAQDKLYVIEFRPILQESPDTSREATVTITDLRVENLAPHQQPSVVAHNSSLQFQEDGNGRAHLRGFVVKDTDLVRVTFERECQTPMNCEWAATPADKDVRLSARRTSQQSDLSTERLSAPRNSSGYSVDTSPAPHDRSSLEYEADRPPGPKSWAPPASFV